MCSAKASVTWSISRLSRRLRALNLSTFKAYRDHIAGNEREVENYINSISTNHTKFFRESHHFDHFGPTVARAFARSARGGTGRMRLWSAGCSSGEEPYTIAAVLKKEIPDIGQHDIRMLATDIDTDIIAKAARAEYPATALEEIPSEYHEYCEPGASKSNVVVSESLRNLIAYRQLNLLGPWPIKGQFDAIFCRNVMIYFDGPTKSKLVERFTQQLRPGGWLYIGHSESLIGSHPGLTLMGRTIYRREA